MSVAVWAMLNGCAEWIKPDLPAHMGAAADGQCGAGQANDEGAAVLSSHIEPAGSTANAAGYGSCHFEVAASESPLRRDAFGGARIVGYVVRGEELTLLDVMDRRLRVLGRVVFDGGHWLKVRGSRGHVGWLPAAEVREIRDRVQQTVSP